MEGLERRGKRKRKRNEIKKKRKREKEKKNELGGSSSLPKGTWEMRTTERTSKGA